jgi:peptidoglycan/xylan/chitin deacetylase (PgdA/CDA1 family)
MPAYPQNRGSDRRPWAWLAFVAAVAAVVLAAVLNWPGGSAGPGSPGPARPAAATSDAAARPQDNDCSGGRVFLTFDDGPGPGTSLLLDHLAALNLRATFFIIGDHIAGNEDLIRREVAEGHSVQNHSYHHFNLVTGVDLTGTRRSPWGPSEIETELLRTTRTIMAAGAPRPVEYRPPYGSVNAVVDQAAQRQGLRLVMPWSDDESGNIVDSKDTETGVTPTDVVQNVSPGIRPDAIVAMHDGEIASADLIVRALPAIVDLMNAKHLCSSVDIRPDATGGVLAGPGSQRSSNS